MTLLRLQRYVVVFMGLLAAAWLLGLLLFVRNIEMMPEPGITNDLEPTDAIVVLTGGSERLVTGLELLNAKKGKKLFISGVHPKLTLDHLIGNQSVPQDLRDCCIILGHEAETTMGNAEETLTWMSIENYHSLRLVTGNYHMLRSLFIFHNAMPDMEIIPHPVAPDKVRLDDWWSHPGTASLLVTEYTKYLLAVIRLWLGAP